MSDEQYLYGASVQGIQSFIFQTNKLKDIVGASELVEQICTTKFAETLGKNLEELKRDPNAILMAAGNIKYIFTNREACEAFVKVFPKTIVEMAPGITISQAVVKLSNDFPPDVERLEALLRTQRNRPMRSTTISLMGILRSRATGLPATTIVKQEYLDIASEKKRQNHGNSTLRLCEKSFGVRPKKVAFNIEEMTDKNDWIAIIHADGNGLGQVIQQVGKNPTDFKKFSQLLDECTTLSAVSAYEAVKNQFGFTDNQLIPIRPIVLGGDDLTLICRADLAIPYIQTFLQDFEKKTQEKLGEILSKYHVFPEGNNKLTACAGIAFIKSSFPFHYGYNLAEILCSEAKKDAKEDKNLIKGLAPSCLMFHKVQDSFVEDFETIKKRELSPNTNYSFVFGPYYLHNHSQRWSISKLTQTVNMLSTPEGNAVKSNLRQWMTILHDNPDNAFQKRTRLLDLLSKGNEKEQKLSKRAEEMTNDEILRDNKRTFPVYDVLSLCSIINQKTNIKTV